MKINKNILYIPPYISTSWDNITSISSQENFLIITLKNGAKIEIPNLTAPLIELIFDTHAKVLENNNTPKKTSISFGFPALSNIGLDSLSSAMQHDPSQKDAPNLPDDLLKKDCKYSKNFY